ncbi:hypothetical protein [Paenibacillus senegalensis]|nr:hypothetical protein [Paenibacillus senegalensis]
MIRKLSEQYERVGYGGGWRLIGGIGEFGCDGMEIGLAGLADWGIVGSG